MLVSLRIFDPLIFCLLAPYAWAALAAAKVHRQKSTMLRIARSVERMKESRPTSRPQVLQIFFVSQHACLISAVTLPDSIAESFANDDPCTDTPRASSSRRLIGGTGAFRRWKNTCNGPQPQPQPYGEKRVSFSASTRT